MLGKPIDNYVLKQISVRQQTQGSGISTNRTPQQIAALNVPTSWVKLASGASVTQARLNEASLPSEYLGVNLAKNYVLFGGVAKLNGNKLSQKEVNFVIIHENFHLLWDHPKRTALGGFDLRLANIAQDMIINHIIWEDISHNFVEIPKDKSGKNMALFVPKEYTGKLIFEELYEWLKEKKDEHQKSQKKQCSTCSSGDKDGQDKKGGQKGQGDQKQDSKSTLKGWNFFAR